MYATRSSHESENGAVVRRVLQHYNESAENNNTHKTGRRFHLKRCTQAKEGEEPRLYVALLETKVPIQKNCYNHMHVNFRYPWTGTAWRILCSHFLAKIYCFVHFSEQFSWPWVSSVAIERIPSFYGQVHLLNGWSLWEMLLTRKAMEANSTQLQCLSDGVNIFLSGKTTVHNHTT